MSTLTKTTEPRKVVERKRAYEWAVIMFKDVIPRQMLIETDEFDIIKSLIAKFEKEIRAEKRNREDPDNLENCIGNICDSTALPINQTPGCK